ncbi:hypothetical protein SNEBB_000716 [Seison nebaliae]|nr:hypothetical protein SNEBB_000716 [Seison nebaliae]
MEGESIKVAVRVRPFNEREKNRNAKCIIQMQGQSTSISNPNNKDEKPKNYAFDYSYWSHDGYSEGGDGLLEASAGSNYASQQKVFDDLGKGVLKNAFDGFNCSLFAYGQTGSGKSYSMVGYGINKGIVPITCDTLFKTMKENSNESIRYEISFSMMEIYNEQVRDLLTNTNPKGGLPVRQNAVSGSFFAQGLKQVAVGSYEEIESRISEGTANRTVASTNMNATSSRAHTIVTVIFDQITKSEQGETKKSSTINLVDLAGSERADSTGATGDRLKEGASINKSLSALGNVISALAEQSSGSKKKIVVPYRDAVLTKLLQNALGGNSKTVMIAALSPADINYDETLSTLRYADRAKKIKNKAIVNENPMDKLIRELKMENEKLRKMLQSGNFEGIAPSGNLSKEQMVQMRSNMEEGIKMQLQANQNAMEMTEKTWEEKLAASKADRPSTAANMGIGLSDKKKNYPYLTNLNEDPMLSNVLTYFIDQNLVKVGAKGTVPPPKIALAGLNIKSNHAEISYDSKSRNVELTACRGAKIKVNGKTVTSPIVLENSDRILFGSNHMFVFNNPFMKDQNKNIGNVTWEFAQKEIAQAKGFATDQALTKEQIVCQEEILELLPMITEMNALSEELNKHKWFDIVLLPSVAVFTAYGGENISKENSKQSLIPTDGTKVMVRVKNLLNSAVYLWDKAKFINRRFLMQEIYQEYLQGKDLQEIKEEEDPFWDPMGEPMLLGTASMFMQSLCYNLDFTDRIIVTDLGGQEEGQLYCSLAPCDKNGRGLDDSAFVEDPTELLKQPFNFKIQLKSAEFTDPRTKQGLMIKYRLPLDIQSTQTSIVKNSTTPDFGHQRIVNLDKLGKDHLDYFEKSSIIFLVYVMQDNLSADRHKLKLSTKELKDMETLNAEGRRRQRRHSNAFVSSTTTNDSTNLSHLKNDLLLLQKKYNRLEQKEKRIQDICKNWMHKPEDEQNFQQFAKTISAVANSSGTRLKTAARMLGKYKPKIDCSSWNSIYLFGDEEDEYLAEVNEFDESLEDEYNAQATVSDQRKVRRR